MTRKFGLLLVIAFFAILTSLLSYSVIKIITPDEDLNLIFDINDTNITKNYEPTIFCIILTTEAHLQSKAKIIYETWASKCDEHEFISIIPNHLKNNKNISELKYENMFNLLQPFDFKHDSYNNLTSKVYSAIKHIYKKHNNYDFYMKADDDTFVFVDNLRSFLKEKSPRAPVTYGYDLKNRVEKGYHSGGGGYLLSNEAFNRLGSKLVSNQTFCQNTGIEDVDIASCLRELQVYPEKSIDEYGLERFHPLNIRDHFEGYFPVWLISFSANELQKVIF